MAKIIGNTTATPNPRPDWAQTDESKADYIKNKPDIEAGDGEGSLQQGSYIYTGDDVVFNDETKGTQNGDIIPGAEATGLGSAAFGGLRYDYYTSPETHAENLSIDQTSTENWGRTSTSAEGKQSFAAGGSVHAYGDWSVAMGKDTVAHHRGSFSMGGGTIAGRTKEEWEALPDVFKYKPTYEQDYSFAVALNESTVAKGRSAIATGNRTQALGEFSFTTNSGTQATAPSSAAFGKNTIADNENQVAIGSCNTKNSGALLSIGCGPSDTNRQDALKVYSNRIQLGKADQIFSDNNTLRLPNSIYTKNDAALTLEGKGASFSSDEIALTNKKVKVGGGHTLTANNTFAAGSGNKVKNDCGIALGQGLTSNNWTQVVVGSYNKENAAARFIVGNGTTAPNSEGVWVNTPNTAFEVMTDGRAKAYGAPREAEDIVRKTDLDSAISAIVGPDADSALDTLKEVQAFLENDISGADGLIEQVNSNTITIAENKTELDYKINHLGIQQGVGFSSSQQMSFLYTGDNIVFEDDGTKGTQTGDTIPGAIAIGDQSIALGGLRWDYYTNAEVLAYNQSILGIDGAPEHWGRTATSAEGKQSLAAGGSSHAYGDWSAAVGKDTKAYQGASISVGGGNKAGMPEEIFNSIKNGENTEITETNDEENRGYQKSYSFAFAAGSGNKSYGRNSFAANGQNTVWMTDGSAFGNGNNVYARNGLAGGQSNTLKYSAYDTFVNGRNNKEIYASKSIISGEENTARSARVLVSGQLNTVTGENSAAFGKNNTVASWNCMSIGENNNITSTGSSFTAGNNNTITNYHNIVSGTNNNVSGQSNITAGARNIVSAGASLIGGTDNSVGGSRSLVVGGGSDVNKNTTTGGATGVIVGGVKNTVSVVNAIVGGEGNTASSWNSFVIGVGNTVKSSGQSIVGGYQNTNTGNNSLVAGQNNNNSGAASLLVGSNLINTTSIKTVVGKNNFDNTSALFVVGNGSSSADADRKNAFEVLSDGRAVVQTAPTEDIDVVRLAELNTLKSNTNTQFEAMKEYFPIIVSNMCTKTCSETTTSIEGIISTASAGSTYAVCQNSFTANCTFKIGFYNTSTGAYENDCTVFGSDFAMVRVTRGTSSYGATIILDVVTREGIDIVHKNWSMLSSNIQVRVKISSSYALKSCDLKWAGTYTSA